MKSKSARALSIAVLLGFSGVAAAGEIPIGEGAYPPEPEGVSTVITRAEVAAELREAQRLGLVTVGEADPYAVVPPLASTKTRAQVVAELREAQRLELVDVAGEGDAPVATAEQEHLITEAGLRARG